MTAVYAPALRLSSLLCTRRLLSLAFATVALAVTCSASSTHPAPGGPGDEATARCEASAWASPPDIYLRPGSGKRVDLVYRGLRGLLPTRLTIPDPGSVESVYVEVVYKGKLPATNLHYAIKAKLSTGELVTLTPKLIQGTWGANGVAAFTASVGATAHVQLDFEVEEATAQSMLLYVLRRDPTNDSYQAGTYASVYGHATTKTFSIPVPRDNRTRDITVTIPVTEITTDGRVLDFVVSAGGRQRAFRRQWNAGFPFDNECCIDSVQATLYGVTGDFDKVDVSIISPPTTATPRGQSFVVSGIVQAEVSPVCGKLDLTLPDDICTDNTVVLQARSPGAGYAVTWDFGEGAHPRTAPGYGAHYLMFDRPGQQAVTARVTGPDCSSTESFTLAVKECSETKCALQGAAVIQHPAHGNNDGVIELNTCVSCGSTPPYRAFYTYRGEQFEVGPIDQTRPRITGLPAGTYEQLYLVDANGCQTNVTGPVTLCNGGCGTAVTCPDQVCTLTGFNDQGRKRAFWLPNLGLGDVRWRWEAGSGELVVTGDKTAEIRGRAVNLADPTCGFEVRMLLRARRTWSEWSALGRDWKGSRTRLTGNQHLNWDYYELVPEASTFVGFGCFRGTLKLTPRPADYRYGVQVGDGANDQNLSPGLSAWFAYNGTLNGATVSGEGDINVEGTCRLQDLTRNAVPIISCAPDHTVACGADPDTAPRPTINCGDASEYTLTYVDRELGGKPRKLERTWTAAGPGGPATCRQTLTFGDDGPPVFTKVPQSGEMSCEAVGAQTAEASDGCGPVTVELRETKFNETCPGNYDLRRVWTATDASGNTATVEAIVRVVDRVGPTFIAPPSDIIAECKDPLPTDNPATADACGGNVSIDYAVTACQSALPIYHWSASQLVYLTEVTDPNLRYGADMKALTLASVCSDRPEARKRWRVSNPNDYPVYVRRVEAYGRAMYRGFVVPANAQVFFFTPQEAGANTTQIFWANATGQEQQASKAAGDSRCESLSAAETCTCVITRRWTAKDACGNTSVYEQKVWQRDTKAPTLRNIPADLTVTSPDAIPPAGAVTATDACATAAVTVFEDRIPSADYDCEGLGVYYLSGASSSALPLVVVNGRPYRIGERPLTLRERCDGTALLTGTLHDAQDPGAQFRVEISLRDRRTHTEHSGAGVAAGPSTCAAADRSGWRYYRLDAGASRLTGAGTLAGTTLALSPVGDEWLQLGAGANGANCKSGAFTRFTYRATAGSFGGSQGQLQAAYVGVSLEPSGACAAGLTLVRVYSAVDECGNRAIERQVVRVADRTPPTLTGLPDNRQLACGAALPQNPVTATDNSAGEVTVAVDETTTGDDCSRVVTRTWTATDACGNSATASRRFSVTDESAPTITFSTPVLQGHKSGDLVVVSCSEVPTLDASVARAADDCDPAPVVSFASERLGGGDCATTGYSQRFKYIWTATDRCGNATAFAVFVEFHDDEAPTFASVPAAVTLTCEQALPTDGPTATDACSAQPTITESQRRVNGACADAYQVIRTWIASDACGNTATASQVVTVTDGGAPRISDVPAATTITCGQPLPITQPKATDACDQSVRLVESSERRAERCAGTYELIRLWTATDNCGNRATASQIVRVEDLSAPTLTLQHVALKGLTDGAELVLDCGSLPTLSAGDAVASDGCDAKPEVTFSQSETALGDCRNDGFVARVVATWSATDACGNVARIAITLRVRDGGKPTLSNVPTAVSIACGDPVPTSQPTVADGCTPPDQLRIEETSERLAGSCADAYQLVRRWRVSDLCGNTAEASQVVTVEDRRRPSLANVPESVTLGCGDPLPTTRPTATDDCDTEVAITTDDTRSAGACAAGYSLVRVFTATDNCGNTATASQVITVRDREAPRFVDVPTDVTIACDRALPTARPSATDACDAAPAVVESSLRREGACPDSYRIVRTWTATDACGNVATATQVITVEDQRAPVLANVPPAVTVSCDVALPSNKPTATDDCDTEVVVAATQTTRPGSCPNAYEVVRLFTATDNCGNAATATQVVTVVDDRGPVFSSLPPNVEIGCRGDVPSALPSASDNCDGQVAVTQTQIRRDGACAGSYAIVRTFSATDRCGNVTTASQVVSVSDADEPVFAYVPADVAQSCAEALPTELPEVTDACDAEVAISETQARRAQACPGTYEVVRTFTAVDDCGNRATASQVVRVFDDRAPVFAAVPADQTIECEAALPTTGPTATDDCDPAVAIALTETREGGNCADSYRVIRTWTATDACGNVATARQVVTVRDTGAPTFAGVPSAISISCNQSLPTGGPTATDRCDREVTIVESQNREPGACPDAYRVVRLWTATDNCGNSATASQVVTVEDRQAPVFANVPAAITIACNASLPSVGPAVSDNCDAEVAIVETQSRREGGCPEAYEVIRVWTATDNCGNLATASQVVVVEDGAAPVFAFVPPAVTIACDAALPATQPEVSDDCDQSVSLVESRTTTAGACASSYTVTRLWIATDNCGNVATATQLVTVEDRVAPTFANVPQATTISCDANLPTARPLVTDACDPAPELTETRETLPGACPGAYAVVRTFTAVDACGNRATASQVVTVVDDRSPTFTEVPAALTLACTQPAPVVLAKATDNCDTEVEVEVTEERRPGACAGSATLVRTFTATDDCGNTATASQVVTFVDRVAPVFASVPSAITIACDDALPTAGPTATDDCDPGVAPVETQRTEPGACADSYRVIRTWTATDACGNSATASQVVTVRDERAPTFVKTPSEVTIACDAALPTELAIASDDCDAEVSVTVSERREDGGCADAYTVIRTFTAVDNCGNTATATQRVNVRDEVAPTFVSVPAAVTIACDAAVPTTPAVARDQCDQQVTIVEATERRAGDCADGYALVRTFTASDNCGNTATASQIVTVVDREAPVFASVPPASTIDCADPLPTDAPTATDDCAAAVAVVETQLTEPGRCADALTVIRVWTATDACGNTATASQRVSRTDRIAPTFASVPGEVTIACDQPLPTDLPTARDNCDLAPRITATERRLAGPCAATYDVVRTFTATDACGNTATASQLVHVEDTRGPRFADVPAAVEIACEVELPADAPTATDACDAAVALVETQQFLVGACAGSYRVIRTWTASDDCGNTATATQLVTVRDRVGPTLAAVPPAVTIACNAALPSALPTASDACDNDPHVAETQQRLPGGCADSYTLVRTFTATDACGNTATASQVVTVSDGGAPALVGVPGNRVIACEEELPSEAPTATDACDTEVTITESRVTEPGACPGAYVVIRTWTATDNCGNTVSASQRVEVGDRAEPTFTSVPAAVTIACGDALPTDQPSATDNCDGNPGIVETATRETGPCADSYKVIRTWIATDACGNRAIASQVVSVVDRVAPTFVSVPAAITIGCDAAFPTTQPRATDACSASVSLAERTERKRGSCGDAYSVTRIWTATDACGNTATASQVVTVEDSTAPVFASVPPSVTVTCDAALPDAEPTATDNCDTEVRVTRKERRVDGPCADSYTVMREWTAVDNCGNTATAVQAITVIDPTGPTFANVPPAVTIACSQTMPTSAPRASDNCDREVAVAETRETIQGVCPDSYVVIRTWTASDNCGHLVTATQEVTIIDREGPRFARVPASRTIDCDDDPGSAEPVATDNCDDEVAITMTEQTAGESCATGLTLTRIWTATDNCGNTATASQVIRFQDRDEPKFGPIDRSLSVACDQPVPVIYPTATDNCDREVDVTFVDRRLDQACGANITRTWIATDDCGNTASATQLILIRDTELPTLSGVPTSTRISCGDALPAAEVTASDNCSQGLVVSYEQVELPGRCAGERIIQRYWSTEDACGNAAVGSQEVVISDSDAPQLQGVPADVELACGTAVPTGLPTAQDACGGGAPKVEVAVRTEPGACASDYRVVRTFTAADACGNRITATQVVTFRDAGVPTISNVPANQTIACGASLPTASPTASDGCDSAPRLTLAERTIAGDCDQRYEVQRIWTATDNCGNTATASQVITVVDDTAPVFSQVPAAVALSCGQAIPTASPQATDACAGELPVSLTETRTDLGGGYTLLRTWSATDHCGNAATATQLITVTAGGEPVFAYVPESLTLDCGDPVPDNAPQASDPCGTAITVTLAEKRKSGRCEGSFELIRTWTARNADGRTATAQQTITVRDEVAPVFTNLPPDLELACGSPVPTEVPQASDNCGGTVRVTVDEKREAGACASGGRVVRTFTARDDCGNRVTATQVVTFTDREAPVFTSVPESEEFQCAVGQPKVRARATDNCTPNVEITFRDVSPGPDCSQRLQRIWTATDACGNTATAVQQILLQDTERPTLNNVPGNANVDVTRGESVPSAPKVTANDNCDTDPDVRLVEERVAGAGCGYVLVRTWTATDRCGNTARGTQRITVTDGANVGIQVAPYNECVPESIALSVAPAPTGATYAWTATAGSFDDASAAAPRFLPPGAGRFSVSVHVSGAACTGTVTKEIVVSGTPLVIETNAPLCTGANLELSATPGAAEYRWTGPAGFVSSERAPRIPAAQVANGGTYRLTATFGDCQQSAEAEVAVAPELAVLLDVPQQVCGGGAFRLALAGAREVTWIAPGGARLSGATVDIPAAISESHRGTWRVEASNGADCRATRSFELGFVRPPVLTTAVTSVACAGAALELTAGGASTYAWSGPNGWVGTGAVVRPTDGRTFGAGTHDFVVTGTNPAGCASRDTLRVTIAEGFDLRLETLSTVCVGGTVRLVASGATDYSWRGPNGFSATSATVEIADATQAASGEYVLVAEDASGCRVTRTVVVAVVDELIPGATLTPATCTTGGAIAIEPLAGVTYDWADLSGADDGASRSGLAAGTYRVTARLGACERTYTYVVQDGCGAVGCTLPQNLSATAMPASCGASDGQVLIAIDAPARYRFTWTPDVSTTERASDLPAGEYRIEVRSLADSTCLRTVVARVEERAGFSVAASAVDASCTAGGRATLRPSVPGAYQVTWSDRTPPSASLVRDSLAAGTYTATLADRAGCRVEIAVVIGDGCGCEAKASVVRAERLEVCLGGTLAEVALVRVTPPVIPAGFEETILLAEASSGRIRERNASGRFAVASEGEVSVHQLVFDPATLPASLLQSGGSIAAINGALRQGGGTHCGALTVHGARIRVAECCVAPIVSGVISTDAGCGLANGTVALEIANPLPGDRLTWSPDRGQTAGGNAAVRTGLPAGTYRIVVARASAPQECKVERTVAVGTDVLAAGTLVTEAATCGQANGRARFVGADDALTFAWSDGGVGSERTDLTGGEYTVTVERAGLACTEEVLVRIDQRAAFTVNTVIERQPGCGSADGAVRLAVVGSDGPFVYSWGPTAQREGLPAGLMTVTVTDQTTGCSLEHRFVLTELAPGAVRASVADVQLDCFGASDGRAELDISYGEGFRLPPQVTIVRASDGTVARLGELTAGEYCAIVRDSAGCLAAEACFAVTQPEELRASVTARAAECERLGALSVEILGGSRPYSYDWAHLPAADDPQDVDGLAAGTYGLVVRDARGCVLRLAGLVVGDGCGGGNPSPLGDSLRLRVEVLTTDSVCLALPTGVPTSAVSYELGGGGTVGTSAFGSWVLRDRCLVYTAGPRVGVGVDLITAVAVVGDRRWETRVYVDVTSGAVASDTVVRRTVGQGFGDSLCLSALGIDLGGPLRSVRSVCPVTGVPARVRLSVSADSACINYVGLLPGVDSLCVVACGLTACDTFGLVVRVTAPTPSEERFVLEIGQSGSFCLDDAQLAGPITEVFNACESSAQGRVTFEIDEVASCITWEATAVGEARGCFVLCDAFACDTTEIVVTVTQVPATRLPVAVDDRELTTKGIAVVVDVLANDTLYGQLVQLMPLELPRRGNLFMTMEDGIRYTPEGDFCGRVDSFRYVIGNGAGFDTATVRIEVACDELVIFSGFSPNGDGVNDEFRIIGIEEYPDNRLIIFNRWGNEVFDARGYDNSPARAFTGRWNGKELPNGTYFYVLDLGNGSSESGYLQLLR